MALPKLLNDAQRLLIQGETNANVSTPLPSRLFFSVSDGRQRARTVSSEGKDFHQAWLEGSQACQRTAERRQLDVSWLRIDWPTGVLRSSWGELKQRLHNTKRNYFRFGLALDSELKQAFLEHELNANAMLYTGADTPHGGINIHNFLVHARRRFGAALTLDFDAPDLDQQAVWLFTHEGLFVSDDPALADLPGSEAAWLSGPASLQHSWRQPELLNSGRRQLPDLQANEVLALIRSGADFLARQVKPDGQFIYGHFPNFGRQINTYNSLRHASTVYSMLEAWELTRDDALRTAIERALDYLDQQLIRRYPQPHGQPLAFNVDLNDEIKLGANAVSLLALVKYDELTGDQRYRPLMEQLALGICHLQQGEVDADGKATGAHPGKFVHVLNAADLSIKTTFRIVYYDGEAAFGLMRLYGLTRDERWLQTVDKAFDYFLAAEHWRHHDHWLSYCANELTLYRPEEKYFRFGVQNIADHLDFILKRETTFPTLLELCMAFAAMIERIQSQHPEMSHVLDGLDLTKFERALHHRAHYQLNGFFWPELALFHARPEDVVGSFFIRHHAFRVRIDDVEHYLSGYVAYWKMLTGGGRAVRPAPLPAIKLPANLTGQGNGQLPLSLLTPIRGGRLLSPAALAWNRMRAAAAGAGILLRPATNQPSTYQSLSVQNRLHARLPQLQPGNSPHGWGLAIVVADIPEQATQAWLEKNAFRFGFILGSGDSKQLVYFCGDDAPPNWTRHCIESALDGHWQRPPPPHFEAPGVTAWVGSHDDRNIIAVATHAGEQGVPIEQIQRRQMKYSALISSLDAAELERRGLQTEAPIFQLRHSAKSNVHVLAHHARRRLSGTVVGITGSAGKTSTVKMMETVFAGAMLTTASKASANLPFGVAWNLCQFPWHADLNIVELAIGQMAFNTALAQPDIAVITNVAPAHLIHHRDTLTIARRKTRIFSGVRDGGWAVICRDSEHFDLLRDAAEAEQLQILTYGEHSEAELRLLKLDATSGEVTVTGGNWQFSYTLKAPGRHMALNSLACLAVARILGIDPESLRTGFAAFSPPAGRGRQIDLLYDNKKLHVTDEAYNANPASMRAALQLFAEQSTTGDGRKLLVLGDMLELGEHSVQHHQSLVGDINAASADHIFLVGEQMPALLSELLSEHREVSSHENITTLWPALQASLRDGDRILLKASNGIGLHQLVDKLEKGSA